METCYDKNETMKLLGNQEYSFIYRDGIMAKINDIVRVRPYSCTENTALDIFMLGYIYGKRAERARKRKGGVAV